MRYLYAEPLIITRPLDLLDWCGFIFIHLTVSFGRSLALSLIHPTNHQPVVQPTIESTFAAYAICLLVTHFKLGPLIQATKVGQTGSNESLNSPRLFVPKISLLPLLEWLRMAQNDQNGSDFVFFPTDRIEANSDRVRQTYRQI